MLDCQRTKRHSLHGYYNGDASSHGEGQDSTVEDADKSPANLSECHLLPRLGQELEDYGTRHMWHEKLLEEEYKLKLCSQIRIPRSKRSRICLWSPSSSSASLPTAFWSTSTSASKLFLVLVLLILTSLEVRPAGKTLLLNRFLPGNGNPLNLLQTNRVRPDPLQYTQESLPFLETTRNSGVTRIHASL